MTDTKKRALVLRDFKDAGTGESFTKDDTPLIEAGAFANYAAGGLIEAAPPAKVVSPRATASRKAKRSATPKAALTTTMAANPLNAPVA